MLLLITDTSGVNGFVGLVRSDESQQALEVIEEVPLAGGTFSAELIPQIAALLQKHSLRKDEIEAFIVVSGPGSFTGLRVGLAAIKGLAEVLHKPIVPVSLLNVLATFSRAISDSEGANVSDGSRRFAVALDAARSEAFVGEYETSLKADDCPRELGESLLSLERVANLLESDNAKWIATPDQSIFDVLKTKVTEGKRHCIRRSLRRPHSEEVALVGLRLMKASASVPPEQLEANYLRRTDAEIFPRPSSGS